MVSRSKQMEHNTLRQVFCYFVKTVPKYLIVWLKAQNAVAVSFVSLSLEWCQPCLNYTSVFAALLFFIHHSEIKFNLEYNTEWLYTGDIFKAFVFVGYYGLQ